MATECPACDEVSDDDYRCEHCGHDLAKTDSSSSSGDRAAAGRIDS